MRTDLKSKLRRALDAPPPGRKEEFLFRTQTQKGSGFAQLLRIQLFHIRASAWGLSVLLFLGTVGSGRILAVWENRERMGLLLFWLPFWCLTLLREELRSAIYQMEELEQACRFSALEVLVSRLFWMAALQTGLLFAAGGLLAGTAKEFFSLLLYMLVPWLLSCLLSLLALPVCGRAQALWYCAGISVGVSVLSVVTGELCPWIYETGKAAGWAAAAVLLAAANGAQLKKFRNRMEDGIWSLQ